MNSSSLALCVLAFVLVPACGDDGLGNGDLGTGDLAAVSHDLSSTLVDASSRVTEDLAGIDFAGVSCGTQTCGSGESCCVVAGAHMMVTATCVAGSSCGDGGIDATCDGPEDCSTGTPNCCAAVSLGGGGSGPMGNAMCTASCPASATLGGGGGMLDTKLCHGASECTNYMGNTPVGPQSYDHCCTYPGVTFHFCAPGLITALSQSVTCD